MRQLYLVRHPQADISPGLCYGSTDSPPAGRLADTVARVRPRLPPAAPLFSSPLRRCRLLAQLLRPQATIDPRLTEISFGRWEQQPWGDIPAAELDAWLANPLHYKGHGGDSLSELLERVRQFLQTLPQGESILVTHGGVMKAVLAQTLNLPQEEWLHLHFDHASVTRVDVPDLGRGRLVWHNAAN